MKKIILTFIIFTISHLSFGQNFENLDSYTVDKFYKKIDLEYDSLDENGDDIEYVYVKTKVDSGDYKIELEDGDGDLYHLKETNIYVKFNSHFGYAGYSTECIMKVDDYSTTIYKIE